MIAVYDKLIYFNEASKYTILRMRTDDPSVPEEARSQYTFRDRMLRFTAVGYGLPQTDSVKLEIEGDWKEGKYGLQFHVENWHELVPPTTEGLLSYLSSGLLKGIGESTARSIVQRFGTDMRDVLEYHPEKLLEIRGITEQKLEEIKTKAMKEMLNSIGASKSVVITPEVDQIVVKSARNIPGVVTTTAKILSVYDIVNAKQLVIDKAALAIIEEVYA